jgi:hypothetical protein
MLLPGVPVPRMGAAQAPTVVRIIELTSRNLAFTVLYALLKPYEFHDIVGA